jgi:acetolactate synthase-1/2/3 large subunit
MGCKGIRVRSEDELPDAMAEFLSTNEPVLMDAIVEKDEHGN